MLLMAHARRRAQGGFSLIELMISIVISLIVVLGAVNLYLAIVESSKATYERNRLTEELRALSTVITRDIRRAGFWESDVNSDDLWVNPFTAATTDISVGAMSGNASNSCVLYAYDIDRDGAVADTASGGSNEFFGIRLNGSVAEVRSDDSAFTCDAGTWTQITSPELNLGKLEFILNQSCIEVDLTVTTPTEEACPCASGEACQYIRSVDLTIEGNLTAVPSQTEDIFETIKIRNDKFLCGTSC